MKNIVNTRRRNISDILSVKTHEDFHNYLLCESIDRYKNFRKAQGNGMGSVLALCANEREAISLKNYEFDEILLTGITSPSHHLTEEIKNDPRIRYEKQNAECLTLASRNYDLVICKEGIHHLARPFLGVYEMLRLTKSVVIIIEPAETSAGRFLEMLGLSSVYEQTKVNNIRIRDNYVFRWNLRMFKSLLNSYYLESGYRLDVTMGWMTSKYNAHPSKFVRVLASVVGYVVSYVPGSKGNYLSAMIVAGNDIPPEPISIKSMT